MKRAIDPHEFITMAFTIPAHTQNISGVRDFGGVIFLQPRKAFQVRGRKPVPNLEYFGFAWMKAATTYSPVVTWFPAK